METMLFNVLLSSGEKAAANVVSKISTTVIFALLGHAATDAVRQGDKPLCLYEGEELEKEKTSRIIRDSVVQTSVTIFGTALHGAISNIIENSDIA